MEHADLSSLTVQPIGFVRSTSPVKFDSPHQPDRGAAEVNRIELLPGRQFELALQDLAGFERIWVISWFNRNQHWRPRVMPPRGPATRRGVFATRSPHRPNPIGLTCVQLLGIDGMCLEVGPLDLIDGTPVLDIKPYLRTVDCFPDSSLGWLEKVEAAEQEDPEFTVEVNPTAQAQLSWLREKWDIDFTRRAFDLLRRDPLPHRTRRILQMSENRFRMACGAWRMFYRIDGKLVTIDEIGKGYSHEALTSAGSEKIIDRDAQLAFTEFTGQRGLGETG